MTSLYASFTSVRSCTVNSQCQANELCLSGVCQPSACDYNGQCAYGSTCSNRVCQGKLKSLILPNSITNVVLKVHIMDFC